MISLIIPITTRVGLNNFEKTLVNLETDFNLGLDILCVVRDRRIFLNCRDRLREIVDRGECLVILDESQTLEEVSKALRDKNEFTFLMNENIILPVKCLADLLQVYTEKPTAGLVTGYIKDYPQIYWTNDVYLYPKYTFSTGKEKGVIEFLVIHICYPLITEEYYLLLVV